MKSLALVIVMVWFPALSASLVLEGVFTQGCNVSPISDLPKGPGFNPLFESFFLAGGFCYLW
jgi:hypothetical protein